MARRRADIPPYRRIMPFLMRGKTESVVYFEQILDVSRALAWLDAWNAAGRPHATIFHVVLRALADMLHARPRVNRFVVGRRVYDRDHVAISFAAKKQMTDVAPLATVKRVFPPGETFADMVAALSAAIADARSPRKSAIDSELDVLLRLPAPVLDAAIGILRRLDAWGLAPRALIDSDPMYASAFVANLGSLQIDAAYHHLYEHGNCPLFVTVGRVQPRPIVVGGAVTVRPTLALRYTYDERIEDGLYCASALDFVRARVEDPAAAHGEPRPAATSSTA
jgi:hypothetical protein